jgi:hypothetical protein
LPFEPQAREADLEQPAPNADAIKHHAFFS